MSSPGFEIRSFAGLVALPQSPETPAEIEIDRLLARVSASAIETAVRGARDLPVELSSARLRAGAIEFGGNWGVIPFQAIVTFAATREGLLRVELASLKAASILPIPVSLLGGIFEKLNGKPGVVRVKDGSVDFDLGAALRQAGVPLRRMPPLAAVQSGPGWMELAYRNPAAEGSPE